MNKTDQVSTVEAPEQDVFQVVEWDVRPGAEAANPDAELDSGCGCGCGCAEML